MNSKSRIPAIVEQMEIDNVGEIECDPYLQDDASYEEPDPDGSSSGEEEVSKPIHRDHPSSPSELLFMGADECSGAYHWRAWYLFHDRACSVCQLDLNQIFSLILSQLSLISLTPNKRAAMRRLRLSSSEMKRLSLIDASRILVDCFVRPYLNDVHPGIWSESTLPSGYIDASRAVAYCDDHDCASLGDDGVQIRDFKMGDGKDCNICVLNADYISDRLNRGTRVRSPAVSDKEMALLEHLRELSNISTRAYHSFIGLGDNSGLSVGDKADKKDSLNSSNDEEEEGD